MVVEKERITTQIGHYGGLWSKEDVDEKLNSIHSDSEKRLALKIQLNFRLKVLQTKCEKSLFFMSSGGKVKTILELISNLKKVINWTSNVTDSNSSNIELPMVLPKCVIQKCKDRNEEKHQTVKDLHPPYKKRKVISNKKVNVLNKRKIDKIKFQSDSSKTVVSCPDDLLGKLVNHFTDQEDETADRKWIKVIPCSVEGGSKSNPKFVLKEVETGEIYISNLFEDYRNGDVKLCDVTVNTFIDATIDHLFTDKESSEDTWWRAEVVDVDIESQNKENPDFFISYQDYGDQCQETEWFLIPLMEDYLNGWVHFVDIQNTS